MEECGKEGLDDAFDVMGEGSILGLPVGTIVGKWEVVHDVGSK